jgi:predicted anti-sigma-YlaC factor YlaD
MSGNDNSKGPQLSQVRCEDIRDLLFDYMSRELGRARSEFVREHLRRCPDCKKQAAEIQSTLDLLSTASREKTNLPSRLSDDRRKKLYWWYSHPVMRWIESHHALFSLAIAAVIIAILWLALYKARMFREEKHPDEVIFPVWIGDKLPPETNLLVLPPLEDEDTPQQ